ncbi:HNH endonuclease [Isoptericola sp. NPDC019693]|uniref:HNH endonuclease n=1 Tax=Isoptericola sp. NPDC019693 TaxID=3364009 RepID=UPI0037AB9D7D
MSRMFVPTRDEAVAAWSAVRPRLVRVPKKDYALPGLSAECLTMRDGSRYPEAVIGERKKVRLSRIAYLAEVGDIDDSATLIRHLCHNPACVEPTHLLPGTDEDNARDRARAGLGNIPFRHGTCKRGHDVTIEANVYRWIYRGSDGVGRRRATCAVCQRGIRRFGSATAYEAAKRAGDAE